MIPRRAVVVPSLIAASIALTAGGVAAQDESASPAAAPGPVIEVIAEDYHFEGLPTSVPAGTSVSLTNEGAELHEIIIVRKNDGVTASFEELLALPQEEVFANVTPAGVLFAAPGETASMGVGGTGAPSPMTTITLAQEGEYFALCAVPQGTTEMPDFAAAPPEAGASPDASAAPQGPPHFVLGMRQEFTVTAAGSSPGPIPTAPSAQDMPAESPAA